MFEPLLKTSRILTIMKSQFFLITNTLFYFGSSIPTAADYYSQISQTPLKVDDLSPATEKIIIEDNNGWVYMTNIELGTPPQTFRAAIDIGWSDILVPSTLCAERACDYHHLYDHAQSASYSNNGTAVQMHYGGFYSSGFASIDTYRIGSISVSNQTFEEATILKPVYLWDEPFDSAIGLARLQVNDEESSLRAKSPFHNMIQQGLLSRNFFSLRLSDSYHNISGELRFSSTNTDLYVEPLITFPVSTVYSIDRQANFFLQGGWQVSAHSISHVFPSSGTSKTSNFSLTGYVAAFTTVWPLISLPREIGKSLLDNLGADRDNWVDCDTRDSQPSLVISLGSENNYSEFVLEPRDYIRREPKWEWPGEHHDTKCMVEIMLHDELSDNVKYIMLGSAFLARWYSVFDYDNATISLAKLVQ